MDRDRSYLDAAAEAVYRQMESDPLLGIPVDPDVAEHMGAFTEDAISEEDVLESRIGVRDGVAIEEE